MPLTLYTKYVDIPIIVQEYILTVAGETDIMKVPIEDINGYFEGVQDDYNAYLAACYKASIPDGDLEEIYA